MIEDLREAGRFQLALNTLGMALDDLLAPTSGPNSQSDETLRLIHLRLEHLERAVEVKGSTDGLPADDRLAALVADQEEFRGAVSTSNHIASLLIKRVEELEQRMQEPGPAVGPDYTFVPTRNEFATLSAHVAVLTGEMEALRQALERKHQNDQTWRSMIGNVLGIRRPPRE